MGMTHWNNEGNFQAQEEIPARSTAPKQSQAAGYAVNKISGATAIQDELTYR